MTSTVWWQSSTSTKVYYEIKQNLGNFAATRCFCFSSETSMTVFHFAGRKPPKCFKCGKMSHSVKHWHRVIGITTGTMWQSCRKRSWARTSLTSKRRRTATSAAPRRRSRHPFRRRGAPERKRNWLSFTQTCSHPFSRSPTMVFSTQSASSTVTAFRGSIPNDSKHEVTAKLQRFIIDVGRPGTLVSDGALEFKSKHLSDLCTSNGIKQEFSAPHTREENGKIERVWGM